MSNRDYAKEIRAFAATAEARGAALARELFEEDPTASCLFGRYERGNLALSEFDADLDDDLRVLADEWSDEAFVPRQIAALRETVWSAFIDGHNIELKRLNPRARECGDEGGIDGLSVGSFLHTFRKRWQKLWGG